MRVSGREGRNPLSTPVDAQKELALGSGTESRDSAATTSAPGVSARTSGLLHSVQRAGVSLEAPRKGQEAWLVIPSGGRHSAVYCREPRRPARRRAKVKEESGKANDPIRSHRGNQTPTCLKATTCVPDLVGCWWNASACH